ncbi:MAG: ribonuclease III [Deltaproteobacteria bacterium]
MKRAKEVTRSFLRDHALVFRNEELLSMALTHPSYAQEKNSVVNNQRLEFLGDGVLNLIVAEYLYNHYQTKAEGELTKIRARVVCEKALLGVADSINMGEYLLLGRGEEMSGGRKRKSILADAVESIIGAIYLDQGMDAARVFVLKHLEKEIIEAAQGDFYDYKSRLQEMVQGKTKENVSYAIIEESGPAHARFFKAGVYFQDRLLAVGEGNSKKEAEQKAAERVLQDTSVLADFGPRE